MGWQDTYDAAVSLQAAADEIERLRAELDKWAKAYDRWTVANFEMEPEAKVLRAENAKLRALLETADEHVEHWAGCTARYGGKATDCTCGLEDWRKARAEVGG